MGETLKYNDNIQEHKTWADDLGALQAGIINGTITSNTKNAYYIGIELEQEFPNSKGPGEKFLKKDCVHSDSSKKKNSSGNGRSQNRIVVKIDQNGTLVENEGWLWRHDERVLKLGDGFFVRAGFFRGFLTK